MTDETDKKELLSLINLWAKLQTKAWQLIIADLNESGYRSVIEID